MKIGYAMLGPLRRNQPAWRLLRSDHARLKQMSEGSESGPETPAIRLVIPSRLGNHQPKRLRNGK
jgi:hypothetical protein